ncbi:MAG: hypothetical protein MJ252_15090 [archaeon]|nr:hypothetical protein [archaeon]
MDNLYSQFTASQRSDSNPNQVYSKERASLDIKLRNLFIDCFVELFFDYNKYLTKFDDDIVFNTNLLFQNRQKEDKDFYKELTESQLFEQFIQKLAKSECSYFDNRIKLRSEKTPASGDKSIIKEKFIIEPYFLKFPNEKSKNSKDLETEMKKKFENNLQFRYENGILKEQNRVLGVLNEIKEEDYDFQKCPLYIYPDMKIKEEEKVQIRNAVLDRANMINKKVEQSKKAKMVVGEPDDKEKDIIKDDIKDIILKIFKSEGDPQSNSRDKTLIIQNMKYMFARAFIIKLLYKHSEKVSLQDAQFKFLSEIIFQTMLVFLKNVVDNEEIIQQAVYLFLSTFNYFLEGKKTLMFDSIKGKFKNYALFMKPKYWLKWLDVCVKEKNAAKDSDKEISDICDIMVALKLDKDFVNTTCELLIAKSVTDNDKAEKCKNTCKTKISKVKY